MAPTKMKLRVRKKQGGMPKSSQQHRLRPEASPDSKCPICLDRFVNVASVERCLHRFCFRCIREWAKNKAECPLCKQPFRSIFHSVRAEDDFKEYVVFEGAAENPAPSASAPAPVTGSVVAPPERPDNPENATSRVPRRSRATRRGPAPQDSSGSSMDEGALQRLLPWLRRDRVADPLLLERTGHILHELVSFARSIEAMQCPPAPSYEEDSGSQSSVINISEDDDSEDADVTRDATQEPVPSISMATESEISLSQSTWDNETPGPSYSSLSQLQTDIPEPEGNPLGGTGGVTVERPREEEEDEEECTIVGYVKPMAERTPELVQLSSDSTEEDEKADLQLTVAKVEPAFSNQAQAPPSPKSYPSTSRVETLPQGCDFGNQPSSDSSGRSGRVRKRDRPQPHRELRRRVSGSSSPSTSPWEMPEPKKCREERRRRKKTRRKVRESKRSRSPHRRRDRALLLLRSSSSSSSEADWHLEKPGGKRKYKTRHLERARRQGVRERSPSVEIIYERQAADRSGRKKRSRKRAREQNSPTIITISSSGDETRHKETPCRRPLTEDEDTDAKNRTVREKAGTAEVKHAENGRDSFTEFIDFLTDYADRNSGARTEDDQDQNRLETEHDLSDCLAEFRGESPKVDEIKNHAEFTDKPASTDCSRGQTGDLRDRALGVTNPSATSEHRSPDADAKSPDNQKPKGHANAPEGHLCGDGAPDFPDQRGTDRTRPDRVLGTLVLEHCSVDVVEPDVRTQVSAPSLVMDSQARREEPRPDGAPRDQKEARPGAGSEPHRGRSEAEATGESQDDGEMSSDV